jgi:hypothetical protein
MTEIKISLGTVMKGDYESMKNSLLYEFSTDATLLIEWEPYCTIQRPNALHLLNHIINDKRFIFDDLFIARQLYFSAKQSRDVVMRNPKFLQILRSRNSFTDYFYERYGTNAKVSHVGMLQRYIQAEKAICRWNKQNRWRLLFLLYPCLCRYVQRYRKLKIERLRGPRLDTHVAHSQSTL